MSSDLLVIVGYPWSALYLGGLKAVVGAMSTKNATIQPYIRPKIKNPLEDPLIKMSKDRREKELQNEANGRQMSTVSGALLHTVHDVKELEREIRELQDGIDEYQAQADLLKERKSDLLRAKAKLDEWCETFNNLIGELRYPPPKRSCGWKLVHAQVAISSMTP